MGLFRWLFQPKPFRRVDDSFAFNLETQLDSLGEIVEAQGNAGKAIWLIVHFTDQFEVVQTQLETLGLDFEIVTTEIDPDNLSSTFKSPGNVFLVLAQLIPDSVASLLEVDLSSTIAMVMLERHPNPTHDHRIEQFARNVPVKTEFGYVLSFDHPVIQEVVNEQTMTVMKQLGLKESELISSTIVSRRIAAYVAKQAEQFHADIEASSAQQWIELNRPAPEATETD